MAMVLFLFKGLLRDRSRSLFPILIVSSGVMLTVFLHAYLGGVMGDIIRSSAIYRTGHVKITTRAYAAKEDQVSNDLALLGVNDLLGTLRRKYPDVEWVSRINFGGLLDVPDSLGETRAQGPAAGMAVDLLSPDSREVKRLRIEKALVRGAMPSKPGEILISDIFARNLTVGPGDQATLIGSDMYGGMSLYNFTVSGTVRFGIEALDRGAIIADIEDARKALAMEDGAGEILGYFPGGVYNDERAIAMARQFNEEYGDTTDEFAPVMVTLGQQEGLAEYIDYAASFSGMLIGLFVVAMSIVLWNSGLIGGLRRYGEIGVRLAIGESKRHVYSSLVSESLLVGVAGSIIGTGIGLLFAWYVQKVGFNIGAFMKNASIMVPAVVRAKITGQTYYIGIIPGLFSTLLGSSLAGIGILRRNTARLFKELEV